MRQIDDSIDAQHIYALAGNQHIRFLKKADRQVVYDGTTNEELIEVLIHRLGKLNDKSPCRENIDAIAYLGGALNRLNQRAARLSYKG